MKDVKNNLYLHDELHIFHKFDDFFRSYTVLSDLTGQCFDRNELCKNVIYNLEYHDQLPKVHHFLSLKLTKK